MTEKTEFGSWAEQYVAQYLENKNYSILDRNYKKPWGEIDIIAMRGEILIFVEVKANNQDNPDFEPEKRVNPEKIRRLSRAVQTYLLSKKYPPEQQHQIDVISLILDRNRGVVRIKHFKNIDV